MVLKKPYAFLIKHFKLIHLLLCIPLIYLILKTGSIASFLSNYVQANYYTSITNIAGTYLNYFIYLAIIAVILLVLTVYFLMRQKKKDTKFYMFLIIYYIVLFFLITFAHNALTLIESAEIEAQTVRMYRDIAWIAYVPQFFFAGFTILRGIGFDLKKFNFDEDAKELEITDIDSEEFELTFGSNAYKYKRTFRRFIREFSYYFKENKFAFTMLAVIIVGILSTLLYLNFGVYHKTYKESQKLSHNNLIVTVVDSVLSNMDMGGNIIKEGKYYLAIALKIKNNSKKDTTLDYENFKIEVANRLIETSLDRTSYFVDYGIPYTRETKIKSEEENVYVITYEIEKELIDQTLTLKILESLNSDLGSITPIYKTVNLKYEKRFDTKEIRTTEYNRILELSGSKIGMVQISLKNNAIQKSYEYTYKKCKKNNCQDLKNKVVSQSKNTLLILDRMFEIDPYTEYYKARRGASSFTKDFIKIRYIVNEEKKTANIIDVTPKELQDKWIFQIPEEVQYAKEKELIVNLRGNIYTLEMK